MINLLDILKKPHHKNVLIKQVIKLISVEILKPL